MLLFSFFNAYFLSSMHFTINIEMNTVFMRNNLMCC